MKRFKAIDTQVWGFMAVICIMVVLLFFIGYKFIWQNKNNVIFKNNSGKSAVEEKTDSYLNLMVELKQFSGSVLIAKKGEVLFSKGYGMANYEMNVPNTSKTKFTIASMSKSFIAAAIMQLVEKGEINLEDTLDRFISDYPNGRKIRVEHLLNMTSGIPDYLDGSDLFEIAKDYRSPLQLIGLFKDKPLEFEPGSRTKYSNSGYALLAYIIEKVTEETLEDYLTANIFVPLDMKDTGLIDNRKVINNKASGYSAMNGDIEVCDYSDSSFHFGCGGIYTTVEDMYKWERAMSTDKILSKASLERIFTRGKDIYSYGWIVMDTDMGDKKKKLIKTGGLIFGFDCTMDRYTEDDIVIIVLGNLENFTKGSISGEISQRLASIVYGLK